MTTEDLCVFMNMLNIMDILHIVATYIHGYMTFKHRSVYEKHSTVH